MRYISILLIIIITSSLLFTLSCKKDEDPLNVAEMAVEITEPSYLPTDGINKIIEGTGEYDPTVIANHIKNLYLEMKKYKDQKFNPITFDDMQKIVILEKNFEDIKKSSNDSEDYSEKFALMLQSLADTTMLFDKWNNEFAIGPTTDALESLFDKPIEEGDLAADIGKYLQFKSNTYSFDYVYSLISDDLKSLIISEQSKFYIDSYLSYDYYILVSGTKYNKKGRTPVAFVYRFVLMDQIPPLETELYKEPETYENEDGVFVPVETTEIPVPKKEDYTKPLLQFKSFKCIAIDPVAMLYDKNGEYVLLHTDSDTSILYNFRDHTTNTFFIENINNYEIISGSGRLKINPSDIIIENTLDKTDYSKFENFMPTTKSAEELTGGESK